MPIYTYECKEHGAVDVLERGVNGPGTYECPTCRRRMANVLTAPSRVFIDRDWNEKANDYQGHGPYHQAKSQLANLKRSQADRGENPTPITEEGIQVAAKAIHEGKANPRPDPQQRQIQQTRREQKERRAK